MGIELNNEQIDCIYKMEHWWKDSTNQLFQITSKAGCGKAMPNDTVIPTPTGDKLLGNIKVGDYVFNRFGKPVKVLGVYPQGELDAYEVRFDDGRTAICNDEHLWSVVTGFGNLKTYTLREIINMGIKNPEHRKYYKFAIPNSKAVYYPTKGYLTSPYVVGGIASDEANENESEYHGIPEEYFFGDEEQRWELVQGLFDVGGTIYNTYTHDLIYRTSCTKLMNEIRRLLWSLGCPTTVDICNYTNSRKCIWRYKINVKVPDDIKPRFFTVPDKKNIALDSTKYRKTHSHEVTYIKDIVNLNRKIEMTCIYVEDPEHLFIANDFIVTHNTTIVRYLIERLGLSHDEVLFMAFMGKAALQLARNGLPAKTIHSAIYTYEKVLARDDNGKIIFKENGKPKMVSQFIKKDHLNKKIKLLVVDEGSMVSEKTALDILSFGLPVIVLGDLNQLPPVFGKSFFLQNPDVTLTKIMRQAENDPIVWLADEILSNRDLKIGVYGNSAVIRKEDLSDYYFRTSDIILTGTNRLRYNINNYCREEIKEIKRLEYPHIGEKVICRKNNWDKCIDDNLYMTNGTTGFVENIYRDSFNGKTMTMDFRPDFSKKYFKNVTFAYKHMYEVPGQEEQEESFVDVYNDKMEYAYAITTHSSQGSSWKKVLYLKEDMMRNKSDMKKLNYTAITRASESIIIVV